MPQNFSYRKQMILWESRVKTSADRSFHTPVKTNELRTAEVRSGPFEALWCPAALGSGYAIHGSRSVSSDLDTFLIFLLPFFTSSRRPSPHSLLEHRNEPSGMDNGPATSEAWCLATRRVNNDPPRSLVITLSRFYARISPNFRPFLFFLFSLLAINFHPRLRQIFQKKKKRKKKKERGNRLVN